VWVKTILVAAMILLLYTVLNILYRKKDVIKLHPWQKITRERGKNTYFGLIDDTEEGNLFLPSRSNIH
jgi:cbb3-type cytochrome oxidase subunit 3